MLNEVLPVRYHTTLASVKMLNNLGYIDLTSDDFDFLTANKLWLARDRMRARRCIESIAFSCLDLIGYPRIDLPVEFIAAVIAKYVSSVNLMCACSVMEGLDYTQSIINDVTEPVSASQLFSHVLMFLANCDEKLLEREYTVEQQVINAGVDIKDE